MPVNGVEALSIFLRRLVSLPRDKSLRAVTHDVRGNRQVCVRFHILVLLILYTGHHMYYQPLMSGLMSYSNKKSPRPAGWSASFL